MRSYIARKQGTRTLLMSLGQLIPDVSIDTIISYKCTWLQINTLKCQGTVVNNYKHTIKG